jgi:hypothetical protein
MEKRGAMKSARDVFDEGISRDGQLFEKTPAAKTAIPTSTQHTPSPRLTLLNL